MSEHEYEGKVRYQQTAIADGYDARRFSGVKGRLTDRREKLCVLRALSLAAPVGPVLDMPCGTGRFTKLLLEHGLDVTAADISTPMMQHARRKTEESGERVQFVKCAVEDLPFHEEQFDLILTMRLLHHIPPNLHGKVLQELGQRTRRWLIVSFSTKYSIQSVRRNVKYLFTGFPRYAVAPAFFRHQANRAGLLVTKEIPMVPLFSESIITLLRKAEVHGR